MSKRKAILGARTRQRRNRIPPAHRVKTGVCYDVAEIAALLGVHRNTVRHWIGAGLTPLDDRRPMVIHGGELRRFLSARRQSRRAKCAPGELYCLRCRQPRKPHDGLTEVRSITPKLAQVVALCAVCDGWMRRVIRADAAPLYTDQRPLQAGEEGTNRVPSSQSDL